MRPLRQQRLQVRSVLHAGLVQGCHHALTMALNLELFAPIQQLPAAGSGLV